MKTQAIQLSLTLMLVTSLLGIGCAKKKDDPAPQPAPPVTAPPSPNDSRGAGNGYNYQSGGTATFLPDSMELMTAYIGNAHPLNNPGQFLVNVNLSDVGSGRFGGVVQLSYYDNGSFFNGYFDSGSGTVQASYQGRDTGKLTAEFNQWFVWNGQKVFHGFFQDKFGAIMLVIDDSLGLADGGLPVEVNGSIWFKNFAPTYAAQSPEKCWFIRIGPYDCRTFMNENDDIVTTSALYPSNGYRRLGQFKGLNVKKAFNLQ
jgi:hypothetical protein